jgi:hypothetical protein
VIGISLSTWFYFRLSVGDASCGFCHLSDLKTYRENITLPAVIWFINPCHSREGTHEIPWRQHDFVYITFAVLHREYHPATIVYSFPALVVLPLLVIERVTILANLHTFPEIILETLFSGLYN